MLLVKELECQLVNLKKLKDIRQQNMGPFPRKESLSGTKMDNAETLQMPEFMPEPLKEVPKAGQCCFLAYTSYTLMILGSVG